MERRIEQLEHMMDAVSGAQLAHNAVLTYFLAQHKSDPQAIASISILLEQMRASLLASAGSDYKIQAFDGLAQTILDAMR